MFIIMLGFHELAKNGERIIEKKSIFHILQFSINNFICDHIIQYPLCSHADFSSKKLHTALFKRRREVLEWSCARISRSRRHQSSLLTLILYILVIFTTFGFDFLRF